MAIITGDGLGRTGNVPTGFGAASSYAMSAVSLTDKYLTDDATRAKLGLKPRTGKGGVRAYTDSAYSSTRGILASKDSQGGIKDVIMFQFNPEQIGDTKDVEWATKSYTGFNSVDYYWVKGGERTLTFKLTFDATASANTQLFGQNAQYGNPGFDTLKDVYPRGVLPTIDTLLSFMQPIYEQSNIQGGNGTLIQVPQYSNGEIISSPRFLPPPVVIFTYGDIYMEGIIASAPVSYTLFNEDLFPVRADVDVTFKMLQAQTVNKNSRLSSFKAKSIRGTDTSTKKRPGASFLPDSVRTFV